MSFLSGTIHFLGSRLRINSRLHGHLHEMNDNIDEAICSLNALYIQYQSAITTVVGFGDRAVSPLIATLADKHANAIAQALGILLLTEPSAEQAILPLARSLFSHRIYSDALQALVRAGPKVLPTILEELDRWQQENDDEGVRSMLDVAVRLPYKTHMELMPAILKLLSHSNPEMRDAGAMACGQIGLPAGRSAVAQLKALIRNDESEEVRKSAKEALIRLGVDC